MIVFINEKETTLAENCNITTLIQTLKLENKRIAIECNKNIIIKSQYQETILKPNDRLEIIHAVGGG
jgi:thiamine biosynthesis protein ThiS